jgi:small subunit ribosomal protein S12
MPTIGQLLKSHRKKKKKRNKTPALANCPQKKATCTNVYIVNPKKPNSAKRKVAKAFISKPFKYVICYLPGIGHNLQKFSVILIRGGRTHDVPGLKYKAVRGKYDFHALKNTERKQARSKYGVKKN